MRLFHLRPPSPAMVIALIALFLSLGGVSYGLATGSIDGREIRNGSITSRDIKTDSVGGRDIRESRLGTVPSAGFAGVAEGVTHFATVNNEGRLLARRGVLSAFKTSEAGDYQVVFDRSTVGCAYLATLVNAAPVTGGALRGQIGVGQAKSDQRALQIQTANQNGTPAKLPFHVAVFC